MLSDSLVPLQAIFTFQLSWSAGCGSGQFFYAEKDSLPARGIEMARPSGSNFSLDGQQKCKKGDEPSIVTTIAPTEGRKPTNEKELNDMKCISLQRNFISCLEFKGY